MQLSFGHVLKGGEHSVSPLPVLAAFRPRCLLGQLWSMKSLGPLPRLRLLSQKTHLPISRLLHDLGMG